MFCRECGVELGKTARFCTQCGAATRVARGQETLRTPQAPANVPPSHPPVGTAPTINAGSQESCEGATSPSRTASPSDIGGAGQPPPSEPLASRQTVAAVQEPASVSPRSRGLLWAGLAIVALFALAGAGLYLVTGTTRPSVPSTGKPPNGGEGHAGKVSAQPTPAEFGDYAAQLRAVVERRGYQPIGTALFVRANAKGDELVIQRAECDNVPDGHCEKLFIAFDGRTLGTDTFFPSWKVFDVRQEGVGRFSALYEDLSNPAQVPPPVKVTYDWNGQKLTALGTPPTRSNVVQSQSASSATRRQNSTLATANAVPTNGHESSGLSVPEAQSKPPAPKPINPSIPVAASTKSLAQSSTPNAPQTQSPTNEVGLARVTPHTPAPRLYTEIPAGTTVAVSTTDSIATVSSRSGDQFRGVLSTPIKVGGLVVVPAGTSIYMRALQVLSGGHNKRISEIRLVLDHINFGGHSYLLDSSEYDFTNPSGKQIHVIPGQIIDFSLLNPIAVRQPERTQQ